MSGTKTDSRQVINRVLLDKIANKTEFSSSIDNKPADSTHLYNLLNAINSELTVPYYMSESTTPDLIINIASEAIQNPETLKNKIHSNTVNNSFTSGTVELPNADGGNVVVTPGIGTVLSCPVGSFNKLLAEITCRHKTLIYLQSLAQTD